MVSNAFLSRPTASEPSHREASIRSKLSPLRIPNMSSSHRLPSQQHAPRASDLSRKDPPSPPGCPPSTPTQSPRDSLSVDEIEELYAQLPHSYSSESDFMAYSSAVVGLAVTYPAPKATSQSVTASTTAMAQQLRMHTSPTPSPEVAENRIVASGLRKQ